MTGGRVWLRDLRRAVSWHRRLLAAGLAAGAVAIGIGSLQPPPAPTDRVLVAARDLAGGALLGRADVAESQLPRGAVPAGALRQRPETVVGRLLAGPVRAGEVLTDVRLVGRSLLAGYGAGLVAAPLRLADSATAGLLRPGDVVDVLGAASGSPSGAPGALGRAAVVAWSVRILSVPRVGSGGLDQGLTEGALVVVAVTPEVAARLAAAATTSRLSVAIRPA